jgi:nucleoid-associated protein Lsr2
MAHVANGYTGSSSCVRPSRCASGPPGRECARSPGLTDPRRHLSRGRQAPPAAHTVPLALDGVTYEIDLFDDNAAALRDELARYISAARRTGGRKVRVATGQSTATASDRERNQQMRAWANANGYEVSERGRLSFEVITAYGYDRKRADEKKHNAALICPARRRCDVLHAMLRNGTHYRHPEPSPTAAAA